MNLGYLALVLQAHLPFVRHPEHEDFLEEHWLFEGITETYIPLLWVLESLVEDDVDFRLTMSLSPTLASMLDDGLLRRRYARHLDLLCDLSEREVRRTRGLGDFHDTALLYRRKFLRARSDFADRWRMDLVGAFRRLQEAGKVEILTSAATHAFLPLLRVNRSTVRAQIFTAVLHYRETFGRRPPGFWLPECGFYPGLDDVLKEAGLPYFFVDSHAIRNADSRAKCGVYAPVCCPGGPAAFGRDPESSKQVWSSKEGYPGDYDYREFYRDIGYDLDLEYIKPYILKDGIRINTGVKYYRITGPTDQKLPYVPKNARKKAALHARDFLSNRQKQVASLHGQLGQKPVVVAPYDAELFGHWWFEGPDWLNFLVREIAGKQNVLRLIQPSEYLADHPANQIAMPGASSWGCQGYNHVWLNGSNDWIYRHLHAAADRMEELAQLHPRAQGTTRRALTQAARELLLAQASDWAFIMARNTAVSYAVQRTKDHLLRFHRLSEMLKRGSVEEAWLAEIEARDNIFPNLDYTVYRREYRFPS
jgi:1,4-alpha-glucan branching enzyme